VFERFTEPARRVMVLAQDEARALEHNSIGTEHLLLGLLREQEGLGARVLESLGVSVDAVRDRVGGSVGQGDKVGAGQIPFSPPAKKVLELSLREALALGHKFIGTEHVLLGVVAEGEGVAPRILLELGVTSVAVREAVIRKLSGIGQRVELYGPSAARLPPMPQRTVRERRLGWTTALVVGWLLFAVALGVGVLIGWAIWG
jgi:ATP-dependent Clp protease ATP-binding subunit ClpC